MEKRLVSLKKSLLSMLVVTVDDKNSSEMFEVAMMSYAIVSKQISAMNIPYFEPVDKILRQRVSVNSFTEQNLYNMTGFSSVDIGELMLHLDVPEEFTLGNGKHWNIFQFIFKFDQLLHLQGVILSKWMASTHSCTH